MKHREKDSIRKERNCQSDLIRVVAMFFVIAAHCFGIFPDGSTEKILFFPIFCTSNSMFFMLSGKYNLRFSAGEDERKQYSNFYKKRFVNIFIPFLVYCFFIHICTYSYADFSFLSFIKCFFVHFLTNNIYYQLWFMYVLTGLLISVPFLAKLVNHLSDFELTLMVLIGFVWNFLSVILTQNLLHISFGFSCWILSSWTLIFVLGYFHDRIIKTGKQLAVIFTSSVICFIATVCQAKYFPDSVANIYDISPVFMVFSMGVYLFLERVVIIHNRSIQRLITFIAQYSFSVYLIHAPLLTWFTNHQIVSNLIPGISLISLFLLHTILVFLCSFAIVLAVDNLLINPLKRILM